MDKFYTPNQIAEILQVHSMTVLRYIKAGKLKALKIGRVYRIEEKDLKDFISELKKT